MSEQKKRAFLVTWKIKNCYKTIQNCASVLSPQFHAESFGNKFKMALGPNKDTVNYQLQFCDNSVEFPFKLRVLLLRPDKSVFEDCGNNFDVYFDVHFGKFLFASLLNKDNLLKEMSYWSEDILTLQCLMECESDLKSPYSTDNSVTGCDIETELFDDSDFLWCFKISDFKGWTESRTVNIVYVSLKFTFRYVGDAIKIDVTPNSENGLGYDISCCITLINASNSVIDVQGKQIFGMETVEYSFLDEELRKAGCFSLKEIRFKFVLCFIVFHNPVVYNRKESKTVANTISASSSSKQDQSTIHSNASENECFSYLQRDLRNVLADKKFTDINLRADEEIFSAHKNVLAARSPVFSAMFDQDMVENQSGAVDIIDVDAKTLKSFLGYIYTSSIDEMNEETALSLLVVADKYQVFPLVRKCSAYLKSVLSFTNACEVLVTADMVNNDDLRSAAKEYIVENSTKILASTEWRQLLKMNNTLATDVLAKVSEKFDEKIAN